MPVASSKTWTLPPIEASSRGSSPSTTSKPEAGDSKVMRPIRRWGAAVEDPGFRAVLVLRVDTALVHQDNQQIVARVEGGRLAAARTPALVVGAEYRPGLSDDDLPVLDGGFHRLTCEAQELPAGRCTGRLVEQGIVLHREERRAAHPAGLVAVLVEPDPLQGSVSADHEEPALARRQRDRATGRRDFADETAVLDVHHRYRLGRRHVVDRDEATARQDPQVVPVQGRNLLRDGDLALGRERLVGIDAQHIGAFAVVSAGVVGFRSVDLAALGMSAHSGCPWRQGQRADHLAVGGIEDIAGPKRGLHDEPRWSRWAQFGRRDCLGRHACARGGKRKQAGEERDSTAGTGAAHQAGPKPTIHMSVSGCAPDGNRELVRSRR